MENKYKNIEEYIDEIESILEEFKSFNNLDLLGRRQYQLNKIKDQIQYAYNNSKYYRKKYSFVNSLKLNSLEDISLLPFLTQEEVKKFGFDILSIPLNKVFKYGETTGSASKPSSSFVHRKNWIINSVVLAFHLEDIINSDDFIAISIPYELSFAAQDIDSALQILNSTIISTGCLSAICPLDRTLKLLKELPINCIICSPTRLLRLAALAEDMGYNTKTDFSLNKLIFTGESYSEAKKDIISKLWGDASVFSAFGTTETNALCAPCSNNKLHCLEERYFFEVIDTDTLDLIEDGKIGELVITSLDLIASPLIRLRTGDLVKKENITCSCGNKSSIITHYGRINSYLTINNQNIPIIDIEQALLSIDNISFLYSFEEIKDGLEISIENDISEIPDIKKSFLLNLMDLHPNLKIDEKCIKIKQSCRYTFTKLIDFSSKPGNSLIIKN